MSCPNNNSISVSSDPFQTAEECARAMPHTPLPALAAPRGSSGLLVLCVAVFLVTTALALARW